MRSKLPPDPDPGDRASRAYSGAFFPAGGSIAFSEAVPLQIGADWILNLLRSVLQGLFGFAGSLLTGGFKHFLLFESPYGLSAPNEQFAYNLEIFVPLFGIVLLLGIATRPFAKKEKAAGWRVFIRAVGVMVSIVAIRPFMDLILDVVNITIQYIFPGTYTIDFATGGVLESLAAVGASGLALVVGGYVMGGTSVLAIVFVMAVLMLREFLWYLIYHGWPILICMWYIDWGPLKPANHIATLTIRTTAYLLLVGPLIALALQTGAMMAGNGAAGGAAATGAQMATPDASPELLKQFGFWFMGLGLAGVFGAKAAMAGGMPLSQIGRGGGKSKSTGNASASPPESGRSQALRSQASEAISRAGGFVDSKLDGAGGRLNGYSSEGRRQFVDGQKARISEGASQFSDRVSQNRLGQGAIAAGSVGKFAATEAAAGGRYAAKNLDESPLEWGSAAADRYRNEPLVDSGTYSDGQHKLNSFDSEGGTSEAGPGSASAGRSPEGAAVETGSDVEEDSDWVVDSNSGGPSTTDPSESLDDGSTSATGSTGRSRSSATANDRVPSEESDTGNANSEWEAKPRYTLSRNSSNDGDRHSSSDGDSDDESGNISDFM